VCITFHIAFSFVDDECITSMRFLFGLFWVLFSSGGFVFDNPDLDRKSASIYALLSLVLAHPLNRSIFAELALEIILANIVAQSANEKRLDGVTLDLWI
jgi:hypothetical protein